MYDLLGLVEVVEISPFFDPLVDRPSGESNPPPPDPWQPGDVGTQDVIGRRPGWGFTPYGGVETSGNGVGSDPYAQDPDLQIENDANAFASSHIQFDLNLHDPEQLAWYVQTYKALSNIYYLATKYPDAFVNGPGNRDFTAQQLLDLIRDVTYHLTTQPVTFDASYDPNTRTVSIDVDSPSALGWIANFGSEAGRNFIVFHELGHSDPFGLSHADREAYANPLAYGMADFADMAFPTFGQMNGANLGTLGQ